MSIWVKVKAYFKKQEDRFLVWFNSKGKQDLQKVFKGLVVTVYEEYRDDILKIILQIANGGAKPRRGQSRSELFVEMFQKLLDSNDDGRINFDDLPKSVVNFIRELAYQVFLGYGKNTEERVDSLAKELYEKE